MTPLYYINYIITKMTTKCPYNPAHIMPIESLLKHLPKCTATNKDNFAHCKFNQLHIVLKETLDQHYMSKLFLLI